MSLESNGYKTIKGTCATCVYRLDAGIIIYCGNVKNISRPITINDEHSYNYTHESCPIVDSCGVCNLYEKDDSVV